MDNQDFGELEMRRKVGELWDKVEELGRLVEYRRAILELAWTLVDYVPSSEEAELEQAKRERACAWIEYLDVNRKAYIST
jgi:hypothetical protein